MKVQAIIPCAGVGVRLGSSRPKPLIALGGRPIFIRTLEVLEEVPVIDSIVLVVHEKYVNEYRKAVKSFALKKVREIIPGGKTRFDSVRKGLDALDPETDLVLIHDAVRPFIGAALIKKLVAAARKDKAAIAAVPVKSTIKEVNSKSLRVEETLTRAKLWEVQTPQVFDAGLIVDAYRRSPDNLATDDSAVVEQMGVPVKVVMGDYKNIKITTSEDILMAEALLSGDKK